MIDARDFVEFLGPADREYIEGLATDRERAAAATLILIGSRRRAGLAPSYHDVVNVMSEILWLRFPSDPEGVARRLECLAEVRRLARSHATPEARP